MRYRTIRKLQEDEFRRLTGVKRPTFELMRKVLRKVEREKQSKGGRPNSVPLADRLLMALTYWREYRTYFHIAHSYGIEESVCYRNIRWIEDALIKSGAFRLPGKKALLASDVSYEVVLVDATETPVERPKKNSGAAIPARRSGTR